MRFPARSPETQAGIATRAATRPCGSRSVPGHAPRYHAPVHTPLPLVDTDGALCYNNDGVAWASRPAVTRLAARIETSDRQEDSP